mgnify:CR=1 FL=1
MIKIKHIDTRTSVELQHYLGDWFSDVDLVYDEYSELYDFEIPDSVPVMIKYWSGVNDNTVYLHIGSRILAIEGAVEIC